MTPPRLSVPARLLFVSLLLSAAVLAAQQDPADPVFRAGVEAVTLDVSVLDADQRPVRGLTADDFTVMDRGEPQPIVAFSAVDLPDAPSGGAAWLRDVAPDVSTNDLDARRIVVIAIDDCHAPFDPGATGITKRIAQATIDHLGPSDLAAVLYTAGRRGGQEFTNDRPRLRAAVERFTPRGAGLTPHQFSASRTANGGLPLGSDLLHLPCAGTRRAVQQALQNTADVLRDWPGRRKIVVFISRYAPSFRADSIETVGDIGEWSAVFDAMQDANVTVYQYDPRGLEVGSDVTEDLAMFADATGGRTIRHTNAPEAGVPQMFLENSSYYVLGIQPLDQASTGRFRRIEVRVSRPDVIVRARAGYFEARRNRPTRPVNAPDVSAAERALAGALPSGDLPVRVTAAARAAADGRHSVVQVVTGFTLSPPDEDGEEFEVIVTAFRDDWKQMATATQRIRATPRSSSSSTSGPLHVDVLSQLELPAGRYEVRTAVTAAGSGRVGSTFVSVEVPDFSRERLSMSGVLVQRGGRAGDGFPTASAPSMRSATTMRHFASDDTVHASIEIHQGTDDSPLPVRLTAQLVDAEGQVRVMDERHLPADAFETSGRGNVDMAVPLAQLTPGQYLLAFAASAGEVVARRQVRLVVR